MRTARMLVALLGLVTFLMACTGKAPTEEAVAVDRPEAWATPLNDLPGLENFYKVSDQLYRGAQPEGEGFAELKKLGINTVVNLRTFHSDRDDCEEAELNYVHITVQAWEKEDEEVADFLRVVVDPKNQPVFVHCLHGSDRTGVMSAVYRIAIQGWSKEEAIREMTADEFGFHGVWQNLIDYVEEIDIERVKEMAGIESSSL